MDFLVNWNLEKKRRFKDKIRSCVCQKVFHLERDHFSSISFYCLKRTDLVIEASMTCLEILTHRASRHMGALKMRINK